MSQSKGTGSWRVSALQGHGDPGGLGTVPTAAWSIPCWFPTTGRAASSGISSASSTINLRETPSDFTYTKKRLFYISSLSLGLRIKFLQKLRPGFAPQTPSPSRMLQGCSSAGTAGSTWKLSLLRPGECFPGVTGAIRAFEGNFLCDTWLRNKV